MITNPDQVAQLSEELRVYDVDQAGWEQEGNGLEANVGHVLLHLVKDEGNTAKSFNDPEVVQAAIAPDALQYALRLNRWAGQTTEELSETERTLAEVSFRVRQPNPGEVHRQIFRAAIWEIANNLHNSGHEKEQAVALRDRPHMIKLASGFLLLCANLQSFDYSFNLAASFETRLAELRQRFGIPEPDA